MSALLPSCNKEDEGVKYFEEDPDCEDLPVPSKSGYNLWGVVCTQKEKDVYQLVGKGQTPACLFESSADTLRMYMNGLSGTDTIGYCFEFLFQDSIKSYNDLKFLKDSVIYLDDNLYKFSFKNKNQTEYGEVTTQNGLIRFWESMPVNIDGVRKGIIVAGGFELEYDSGKEHVTLSKGRFDFYVDSTNFVIKKQVEIDSVQVDSLDIPDNAGFEEETSDSLANVESNIAEAEQETEVQNPLSEQDEEGQDGDGNNKDASGIDEARNTDEDDETDVATESDEE